MNKESYDAIIIGAGVTGSAIAYQLSRRKGRFLVLEEKGDVCEGTSKANSGIAHGGYDAKPGSLKAKMNRQGIRMMEESARTLDFDYQKIGSLVLCHHEEDRPKLEKLYQQGVENGSRGMKIVEGRELRAMEPRLADDVVAALYCSEAGIVDPFMMTLAFAEQANVNGVEFKFYQRVIAINPLEEGGWLVRSQNESYRTKAVINAAGLFADRIHNMVSKKTCHIQARRGEYMLLDREANGLVKHVIFDLPSSRGKGVLVAPTCDGNVLLGPTSSFIFDKGDLETSQEGLAEVRKLSQSMVKDIPYQLVITSFSGNRAHEDGDDFILDQPLPGFFDCVGIESPGLTSSPAIALYMADMVNDFLKLPEKADFIAERKGIPKTRTMTTEERAALIKSDPDYGQIICRCESVTEGEILNAIHRPLGARSLDGLKRRCRATAGRCQGGFCTPRLIEILAREWEISWEEINKSDTASYLLCGRTK